VEKSIEFSHFDIGKWRNFGIRFFGNFIIKQKKYFFSGFRLSAEEAPGPPRGKRVPGAEINRLIYRGYQLILYLEWLTK
jgi:hypothetical protein